MRRILVSCLFVLMLSYLAFGSQGEAADLAKGWEVKGDFTRLELKSVPGGQLDEYIEIEITPDDPITIPGEGDWFEVGIYIENLTADDVYFDAWMDVELPWGYSFELVSPVELMLPAGFAFEGSIWLYMPFFAPEGAYSVSAHVGDYPDTIWDEDNLTVIKEEWQWPDGAQGWEVKGDLTKLNLKSVPGGQLDEYIEIEITPDDPITIPGEGDWFEVGIYIENLTADDVYFDAWMDVELPWGYAFELVSPVELMLPAGFAFEGSIWLYMPFFAPEGAYSVSAHVGDYPDTIWDEDNLTVIKEEWQWPDGALDPRVNTEVSTGVHPNPFNPTTTLSFNLPVAQYVSLAVYDVTGRKVAQLVDGYQPAGSHDATFDASHLASGVYFYRLEAGQQITNGKLMLVK